VAAATKQVEHKRAFGLAACDAETLHPFLRRPHSSTCTR
jgi:hypothetical protein